VFVLIFTTTTTTIVEKTGSSWAEWLTAIGTVGATLAAVVLGFGLKEWVFRPKLRFRYTASTLSTQVVTGTMGGGLAAYVRLGVANVGRSTARQVRVSLLELERWDAPYWSREGPEMDAATFIWSNWPGEQTLDIPPTSERPLDLFAILKDLQQQGEMPMELQLTVRPANRSDRLAPGSWRIKVAASADNAALHTSYLAFRFDGNWPGVEPDGSGIWRAVAVADVSNHPPRFPPTPELRAPEEMIAEALELDDAP
jgi:hypothetical protein